MVDKYKVFVYGTLKRGFSNNRLLSGSKLLGKARTEGKFALYESGIPFVIEHEKVSQIAGEIYEVDKKTLSSLDRLEGHPAWYCRKMVDVSVDAKERHEKEKTMQAWIYFFPKKQGVLVKSGVFGRFVGDHQ